MTVTQDDCFVVFVRAQGDWPGEVHEREVCACPTYEEAKWVRIELEGAGRQYIIRYVGPAGGGD